MKRDMDLVRQILFAVEASNNPRDTVEVAVDGWSDTEVSYHVELLAEAGLIKAVNYSHKQAHDWRAVRLTWQGHEFLEAARNDTIWHDAKSRLSTIGSFTFDIAKDLLTELIKKQAGLA